MLISMMVSHGAPSKAILWIWHMSGKSFSLPAALMQVMTSLAVPVPCSFCPLSSSVSMTSHVLGVPSWLQVWVRLGFEFGSGLGLGLGLGPSPSHLLAPCKDVSALAVAPAEARCDEVRRAAALEKGVLLRG